MGNDGMTMGPSSGSSGSSGSAGKSGTSVGSASSWRLPQLMYVGGLGFPQLTDCHIVSIQFQTLHSSKAYLSGELQSNRVDLLRLSLALVPLYCTLGRG
jgi:hypothetical protein